MPDRISSLKYDVFLSYKSEDASWARRLAETLRGFGLRVFRDHDRDDGIKPSERWNRSLEDAVREAQVMVVLWSEEVARDSSSFVHEEIRSMARLMNDSAVTRRFVPIQLDDSSLSRDRILSPYHAVVDFKGLYKEFRAGGAEGVNEVVWSRAVLGVLRALGVQDVAEIRYVVAAMTRDQAIELRDNPEVAKDKETYRLMREVMDRTVPFDINRYGETPDDWRPLPQLSEEWTVREIIGAYDRAKRDWHEEENSRPNWLLLSYSDGFLSDDLETRNRTRYEISKGPCLVFLDPPSLMHKVVYDRAIANGALHTHKESFILGIAPWSTRLHPELSPLMTMLEDKLRTGLEEAYKRFQEHFVPMTQACILNVEHEHQLIRWLQFAADNIATSGRTLIRPRGADPSQRKKMTSLVGDRPGPSVTKMGVM